MALQGATQLRARLRAIRQAFKPLGKDWAAGTTKRARRYAPRRTGKGATSLRVRNASGKKATVVGLYYMGAMMEQGTKAHAIKPKGFSVLKFEAGGQTIFRPKAMKRAQRGNRYAARAANEELEANGPLQAVVKAWNEAA